MNPTTRSYRVLALALASMALVACNHNPSKPDNASGLPGKDEVVNIDKRLLVDCAKVEELKSGKDVDTLEFNKQLLSKHTECALRHKALSTSVKKAFNIKD